MFRFLARYLRPETKALDVNSAWALIDAFGGATASGLYVGPEAALRNPVVYASVKILAELLGQLPLHLYRRDGDAKERAVDHPVYALVNSAPNDWTDSFTWRCDMMLDLLKHGSAFAFVNRSRATGAVAELIQVPATAVTVEHDNVTYEPTYFITDGAGVRRQIDRQDLMHLRTVGGLSPIQQIRETIALSSVMELHAAKLFGSGARPAGMLRIKGRLNPVTLERLQSDFQQKYGGLSGGAKTLVLEDDADFKPVTFSSTDAQFVELRKLQVAEVSRAFKIPLSLLNELERVTHANAESLGQQYVSLTMMPWIKMWEQGLHRSLLAPEEQSTYYFAFMTNDLVRADIAARFDAYAKAIGNGIVSANEIRAMEDMSPLPGGDALRAPLNTAPVGQDENAEEPA